MDPSSGTWSHSVLEMGQNAISTLLQPPIVRTGLQAHTTPPASSSHRPPTSKDIPPVALTNIEHIDASEFKPYLHQMGALYEQLQRAKETEDDGRGGRKGSRQDDDSPDDRFKPGGPRPPASRKSSVSSIASFRSIESSTTGRRGGSSRKHGHGPPPLSTIPNVYFEEDFHLENPRTFDVVSERSEVVPQAQASSDNDGTTPAPRKALATNAILQEKLSWYMDTVEVHLINSISTASTTFFTALGSLRELHSEAADSVERIKALRKDLVALDENIVAKGLELSKKRRKCRNLQQLNDAILQLKFIVDGVARCEALVEKGDVDTALTEISGLEQLIMGVRDDSVPSIRDSPIAQIQLRDLSGAVSLQGVHNDLDTLRFRIGKVFGLKLQEILTDDLRNHVQTVSIREVLQRWGSAAVRARGGHVKEPSVFPTYLGSTDKLRAALLRNIIGLHRANHVSTAITAYRESVLREIRTLVRKPLPSSNDDDADSMMSASTMSGGRSRSSQERSAILARNLRALDAEDSEELLATVYVWVSETLRRVTTQTKVLLDIASEVGDRQGASGAKSPSVRSPNAGPNLGRIQQDLSGFEIQEELHKALDLGNLLGQAVDVSHDKILRILRVRSEQSINLELSQFLRYFTLNLFFANECEAISGRSGTALKTLINNQIMEFVKAHGDREMQILAQGMGPDDWSAKDFGDKETKILDEILQSSTRDPPSFGKPSRIWLPPTVDEQINGTETPSENGTKEKARGAKIDDETFLLPKSAHLCLEGISHFIDLMCGIPSMTADIATSLIAYLQMFNSRCTQLILGAGATRSAGLKNITAKHLALASQALSFLATLIPHIREFVRRHAGSGPNAAGLMGEFDKVRRLLQEHQDSIYQKLVDIMSGRALAHCKSMKAITDWGTGSTAVHPYAETLSKETATLHRALTKNLPERSIQMIMVPVFKSYKDQFGEAFRRADPRTEAGRESMLRDIEHLATRLGKIEGFGDLDTYLTKIVKGKDIKAEVKPEAAPQPPPETPPKEQDEEKLNGEEEERKTPAKVSEEKSDSGENNEEKKPEEGGEPATEK
ncbi:hypothetical protein jhhlp_006623 [Lomentospora prolificans]|uniref:Vacuolar protein sorting-associated protein 54 C-terminal domain-containing protein n=1 Tax=Lomentospora prolificans TaxID=41688 RepID=A0A2N3N6F0_9PEZI|nr:hypothetical protein jhhlp_006623 [Lomentospora prolificans]